MIKPIVTVRGLKNKDTGIDVQVPSYKGETGLLSTTYKYNIVVVSNRSVFKTADQTPSDVVQFMTSRPDEHFMRLRHVLCSRFPHVPLPAIAKLQSALFADVNPRERKVELERFLKAVVTVKELVTYHMTLEFLGVPPVKAYNYMQIEKGETVPGLMKSESEQTRLPVQGQDDEEVEAGNLFSLDRDNGANDDDLFSTNNREHGDGLFSAPEDFGEESGLDKATRVDGSSKLFEDQDYTGGVSRSDAPELFLVSNVEDKETEASRPTLVDDDNSSDLFNIDDDIEALLQISSSKKPIPNKETIPDSKPDILTKPVTKPKPSSHKPTAAVLKPRGSKPEISRKPGLPPKPGINSSEPPGPTPVSVQDSGDNRKTSRDNSSSLDADDIFKYIQDNAAQSEDEVDLFS